MENIYDVIVVGGGHAGCEAATAAAKMGSNTLLVTMDMTKFAQMSCNPAMGGVGKGQIIREIDALGGNSALVSDYSAIQFRILNRSKGPAMWSPRTQNDRALFTTYWRELLENIPNLSFWQDNVVSLLEENGSVIGVKTSLGIELKSRSVILTSGTFMNGLIHVGKTQLGGGRMGEKKSSGITEQLTTFGFESGRMKTGTPPRIDGRSLDTSLMEIQEGDAHPEKFSFHGPLYLRDQRPCHITYTNPTVHEIIHEAHLQSPLFNGQIDSVGPRYCPSVEDKVYRFADKTRHQIFVEPEGWNTHEVYVNGFSTSLPLEIQQKAIKHIPGFSNAVFFRPGYAIEYDYFPPTQLNLSLETKILKGLYFAGQINGTTGYEEAAAQGLMAGINASLKIQEKEPLILSRKDAYIGVLIDDLITKGTEEPYRMFTSRAEYRITLRQDSADERLTPIAHAIGMVDDTRIATLEKKRAEIKQTLRLIRKTSISPNEINPFLESIKQQPIDQKVKVQSILSRPNISLFDIKAKSQELKNALSTFSKEAIESAEIQTKYESYIKREQDMAHKMTNLDKMKIPENFDYNSFNAVSTESREKLSKTRPTNLGQASRIPGVKPSDISVLIVSLERNVSHETTKHS
jgi:tRNA uridine 5-carboxymethylaminomethyl modification enzyme